MKYRILVAMISLSICLGLTACGEGEDPEETTSTEGAVSVSNDDLDNDSVVISVGKTTVKYNEYQTYFYFMRNPYEGVLGDEIWKYNKADSDGKSLGQEAVEAVLRLIIQVKVICKEAAMQEVSLGTDEKEQASHNAKSVYDSLDDRVKEENGIDLGILTRIFEENKLAQKMYNIEIGKVSADLTAEQVKAARVQLIYLKADDAKRAEVREKAEQIRKSLSKTGTSFYTVAKSNTEATEIEVLVGGSDTRTNLAKAVVGMKAGTVSGVIDEKDGVYIAYCVEADSKGLENQYRNQVILEKQTQAFQQAYSTWADQFEVKVSKALLVGK